MTHDELKILVSSYADGEITPSEKEIVEEHLEICAECQKDLAAYRKLSSSLKQWPDERLSPDVEMKIARTGSTKERSMEKRELSIQWGAVTMIVAVMAVSLWGVQHFGQTQLSARMRDASQYVSLGRGESYQLSKAIAGKPAEEMSFKRARLKSSADDVGDQFTTGNAKDNGQSSINQPVVGGEKKELLAMAAPSKGKAREFSKLSQSEPYYLESNYTVDQEKVGQLVNARNNRRDAGTFQQSSYQLGAVHGMVVSDRIETDDKRIMAPAAPYYYPTSQEANTESYDAVTENAFLTPTQNPLSTFSIDVDTASYSNIRRFLNQGQVPPQDAVRIEEIVNYFSYDYPDPMWGQPFSITTEVASCPWNPSHHLALIGLQGKRLNSMTMPASNLVFLIDVSGSMDDPNKLPLLQEAFRMMTTQLAAKDKVSIVVYAGAAGLVLDATPGNYKERILSAIDQLRAGGSTAGGDGIRLAYQVARNNFIPNGNNRVILATDGDFNVGISSDGDLVRMIEDYRDQGVFLTVLGFGMGNYKDSKMEKLADKGNGNYFYIDNENEAQKVLVDELGSTLFAIAKDVKIQVEFNPATVKSYRLIGYENRILAKEDFNDDTKDAGELGAGHTVTALYEIVPTESYEVVSGRVDPLVYQKTSQITRSGNTDVMTVKLRYKDPKGTTSKLIKKTVSRHEIQAYSKSDNFRFASAAAEFGLLLQNSPYRAVASFDHVLNQVRSANTDKFGYRSEFENLVEKAKALNPYVTPIHEDVGPRHYWGEQPSTGIKSQK